MMLFVTLLCLRKYIDCCESVLEFDVVFCGDEQSLGKGKKPLVFAQASKRQYGKQ